MSICKATITGALGLGLTAAALVGAAPGARAATSAATSPSTVIDAWQSDAGGPATQLYELNLTSSNKLLTDHGNSMTTGTTMDLYDEVDTTAGVPQANQLLQWVPDNGSDDMFQGGWGHLKNAQSGLCLNLKGGTTALFAPVIQWACGSYANEEFKALPVSPGSHQFKLVSQMDPSMGIGVNDDDGDVANNYDTISRPTADIPADTTWSITRIGGTPIGIGNFAKSDEVLDSLNTTQADGLQAGVHLRDTTRDNQQTWYLQRVGTKNVNSRYAYSIDMSTGQKLTELVPATAPTYRLVSVGNDWAHATCLGTHGDHPDIGAAVETYRCDPNGVDQANQQWIFDNSQATDGGHGEDLAVTGFDMTQFEFAVFSAAMLDPNGGTSTYPVLAINAVGPASGSKLTMHNQSDTPFAATTQIWSWFNLHPSTDSGSGDSSGTTTSTCVGEACLVGNSYGSWDAFVDAWKRALEIN
ncbi:RICIN domain-containing protein [Flexivirga oryzae]|uniref:Ricin B lectin domain-containing protein n=1 Tax=Flexivirga oryzae TaxID=1794944 RepID=A0A839N6A1_9MICO|nr:RICIN domain-containing protein [Flexivirga oryzae]MBB2891564.1 hypothetical protein [Flexivirga oryzae]